MSIFTKKLNLFKYIYDTDKNNTFNIKSALNDNFDKIEAAMPLFKYNSEIEFDAGDWVIYGNSFYISLIDENTGNTPSSSPNAWQLFQVGTLRHFGELVFSAIPQTDEKLHLLNGNIIYRSSNDYFYAGFIDKMAQLAQLAPNYFCTEEEWQNILASSQKESCGKFVYNSNLQSLRLPKVNTIIEAVTDLSVLGNLIAAGLPPITHTHTGTTSNAGSHSHTGDTLNAKGNISGIKAIADGNASANGIYSLTYSAGGAYSGGDNRSVVKISSSTSGKWSGATSEVPSHNHTFTSESNSQVNEIYGRNNTDTVQPETIKQLIYIVVAE